MLLSSLKTCRLCGKCVMYHIIYIMTVVYVNLTALSDQLHCIEKCVHQNTVVRDDALRIVTDACVLHQRTTFLSSQTSNLLELVSRTPSRAVEQGSALTCLSSGNAQRLKSICTRHATIYQFIWLKLTTTTSVRRTAECEDNSRRLRIFVPRHRRP